MRVQYSLDKLYLLEDCGVFAAIGTPMVVLQHERSAEVATPIPALQDVYVTPQIND